MVWPASENRWLIHPMSGGGTTMSLLNEAERCRREAQDLAGKPDAAMLLKIAEQFEILAYDQSVIGGRRRSRFMLDDCR